MIYLSLARQARASSSSASCSSSAPPTRASASRRVDGVELLHDAPVVREFARAARRAGRRGARPLRRATGSPRATRSAREYPEHADGLLVAITERRTREDIDRLADSLGAAVADRRAGKVAEVAR